MSNDFKFNFVDYSSRVFQSNIDDFTKKNMLICHPDDYIKIAESGLVYKLTAQGVKVVQSTLSEKGKYIVTGALAEAVMKEEGVWKGC